MITASNFRDPSLFRWPLASWLASWLACPVVFAALLVSCRPPTRPPGTIVVLTEAPIGRLDPRFALSAWEVRVSRLVAPGLTVPGYAPGTAGLAASVRFVDATHVEVMLRSDAKFSSGRPVHAQDVAFTFESILDPATKSPYGSALSESLQSVRVLDARTVEFALKVPRASFTADLQMGIVDPKFAASANKRGIDVVGAGPYLIKGTSPDRVELLPNPFASAKPASGLVVRTIRDDNARIIALLGRSGDALVNGVTPQVLQALRQRSDLRVSTAASATVTYLGFNVQDPTLSNASVRKAIAMSINRAQLVRFRLGGQAQVADSLLASDNPFHAADVPQLKFDPSAAKQLLDSSGHSDPDGAGPLPRFTLVWKSSNNRFRASLAEAIAKQLAEVGIAVEVRAFEFATLMKDLRRQNFQLFSLQMTDVYEPDWLRSTYHSSRIPSEGNGWSGLNRFHFSDPGVDRLLEQAAGALDTGVRRQLYARVQRQVAEALPCFPLWHEHNLLVTRQQLVSVGKPRTGGLEVFHDASVGAIR